MRVTYLCIILATWAVKLECTNLERKRDACSNIEFQCPDGICIRQESVCDSQNDCGDNADEIGCSPNCTSNNEFLCPNGSCIPRQYVMDGNNDCGDGSDESTLGSTVTPVCGDVFTNCTHYTQSACCGIYEPWARAHCAGYCGYCGVIPDRLCNDTIDYCDREPEDLCTNDVWHFFREENCAGYCKVCETDPWRPAACTMHLFPEFLEHTTESTDSGTTEELNPECGDVFTNCSHYLQSGCCDAYESWALAHCAEYCGYCGRVPTRLCTDTIDYCSREPDDLCTNEGWHFFREENCAGYCKLCEVPWYPPHCTAHLFPELTTVTSDEDTTTKGDQEDTFVPGHQVTAVPS